VAKKARAVETGSEDTLALFHAPVQDWFGAVFNAPTRAQRLGWPAIAHGDSVLILAPTGSGKTLAAFLWCLNRLMFSPRPARQERCRVLYVSPIKALAVDVERNLRAPLVGISHAARRADIGITEPGIAIRTGDTSSAERSHFTRHPSDILITTPESLYLLLTSSARETLRSVETVIIDEIHALTPTKRGAHFALSLERLEALCNRKLQRIGLSATQRPLEIVAQFLGGASGESDKGTARKPADNDEPILPELETASLRPRYRAVTIVDASEPKRLDLKVEAPIEDMARVDQIDPLPSGPASQGPVRPSIWSAIHPKLLELVQAHQSTLIFVNSRRLAERVSGAINELAGEVLVRAHHGSVAAAQRKDIEERLKLGTLRGLVATSSLELGIDMGAVDLVVQIEAPPSVASGMQRVGRSSHHVGGVSSAVIFPKFRGDLIACAAITRAMSAGEVESVRYPRNALDVLAQQIVAAVAMDSWDANELFTLVRRAAPYSELSRSVFDSVLDMLSGRYPSDDFAELRPRLTWDRISNKLTSRQGARLVAVVNGGTIPDRGLYGVFLAGATKGARVGELDEEMIFESRPGDTIILGATTWRIEEITHDRVLVSPAPGEPGKMPFWKGDTSPRPAEFGRHIGQMTRELLALPRTVALISLMSEHSLDQPAAENLLRYLDDQMAATGKVPNDQEIVIERCRDELGDWRVCVLTPFGSAVHAPWCMAVTARLRYERNLEAESMWSEDGFVVRLPDTEAPLDTELFLPSPAEFKELVLRQLGSTALFAAKFREAAGRALLLPKRRAGMRAPLWQQRKRASDLLSVAARFPSFPILLEAYRECVRDVLDLDSSARILNDIQRGRIRITTVQSDRPSPFASALLFSYIANYIYDGDAPLAERRAQALSIDQSQLEEILGSTDFRELLDKGVLEEIEARLQALDPEYQVRHTDGLHDLLLKLGDLTGAEIELRCSSPDVARTIDDLVRVRRALAVRIAGEMRYIPVEYAARYRDALGVPLPPGLPEAFLRSPDHPASELIRRYARTHGPFTTIDVAKRLGFPAVDAQAVLAAMHAAGQLYEGEFRPGGVHREWCDPEVLQQARRRTLAQLRREVVPAEQQTFARFLGRWQSVTTPRRGLDALLDAVEILQGASILASDLETEILPARVSGYRCEDLDALLASGEIVWMGKEQVGDRDGRIALYLTDAASRLLPREVQQRDDAPLSERAQQILEVLRRQGASFFSELHRASGGNYPGDTQEVLWELVWRGYLTNDTLFPLRNLIRPRDTRNVRAIAGDGTPGSPEFLRRLRARGERRSTPEGRWSLLEQRRSAQSFTEYAAAVAQQMLVRNGIVMRESASAEDIAGGYSVLYPALRTMEEGGWIRRGMFVAGMGAAQFATTAAVDMLRSLKIVPDRPEVVHLAAADPANPYGNLLPWPKTPADENASAPHGMARAAGASVVLVDGQLAAFLRRKNPAIRVFLPDDEPDRSRVAAALARRLAEIAARRQGHRSGLLIAVINDEPAPKHMLARFLEEAGFAASAAGYQMRRAIAQALAPAEEDDEEQEGALHA
jgi:ATP-dependent Lhr-like helicase